MIYDTDAPTAGGTADAHWPDSYATACAILASGWPQYDWEQAQIRAERHAALLAWLGARLRGLRVLYWPLVASAAPGAGHNPMDRETLAPLRVKWWTADG